MVAPRLEARKAEAAAWETAGKGVDPRNAQDREALPMLCWPQDVLQQRLSENNAQRSEAKKRFSTAKQDEGKTCQVLAAANKGLQRAEKGLTDAEQAARNEHKDAAQRQKKLRQKQAARAAAGGEAGLRALVCMAQAGARPEIAQCTQLLACMRRLGQCLGLAADLRKMLREQEGGALGCMVLQNTTNASPYRRKHLHAAENLRTGKRVLYFFFFFELLVHL